MSSPQPAAGDSPPHKMTISADDNSLDFLRQERARIKADLQSCYGDRIAQMERERDATMSSSPAQEREKLLLNMISNRTPLRQQVLSVQEESIRRLIEHAKEQAADGKDNAEVQSRLEMLLGLQEQQQSPSRARETTPAK